MQCFKLLVSRVKRLLYLFNEHHMFARGKTLSHITYCLAGNSGDTVLSWCVRKIFEENKVANKWNIKSVANKVDDRFISSLNKTDGVVVGGGGLFLPDTNENSISGWQWAISRQQIKKITKPLVIYCVGYNYFPGQKINSVFKENLNELLEKSAFFGLRNTGSVNAVRELVDKRLKYKVVYQPCITTLIRKICVIPPKKRNGVIAFNFAFDRAQLRFGDKKEHVIRQLIYAMQSIEKRGYKVLIVAHMKEDLEVLKYTERKFEYVDASRFLPNELFKFYNGIDMVVGMRGHAQMIPFGVNCEILSICSHDKMKWFLEDIDCSDWGIDINENLDDLCEIVLEKFIDVHERQSDITSRRLVYAQDKLYEITIANMSKIANLF